MTQTTEYKTFNGHILYEHILQNISDVMTFYIQYTGFSVVELLGHFFFFPPRSLQSIFNFNLRSCINISYILLQTAVLEAHVMMNISNHLQSTEGGTRYKKVIFAYKYFLV